MAIKTGVARASLMGLPPELREAIFKYVVTDPKPIIIPHSGELPEPGLLSVCRQVYSESVKLYYQRNKFRAIIDTDSATGPETWIAGVLESEAALISSLVLEYHSAPSDLDLCEKNCLLRGYLGPRIRDKLLEAEKRVKTCIIGLRKSGLSKEALRIQLATTTSPRTQPVLAILLSLEQTACKLNGIIAITSPSALEAVLTYW